MSDILNPSVGVVAIACVVESSLILASEWPRIFLEYISPLLKRLTEIHPSHQFRIGFVTYATADARPSPILARRFFSALHLAIKEAKDEPAKLGIGQTSSGGVRGMAALEGIVAAVELFDSLRLTGEDFLSPSFSHPISSDTSLLCHIFHIAASPPDNAQRPLWNASPSLDSVTWGTLPYELKKRDINLSVINLRQLPRFPELHSSVAAGTTQQPWFTVRRPHTLLLTGFAPQHKSGKRLGDNTNAEKTPEFKRPRLQPSPFDARPGASIKSPEQAQLPHPHPPAMLQSSSNPPSQSQLKTARISIHQQQQITDRLRLVDTHLQHLERNINDATTNGNAQLLETLKLEHNKHVMMRDKLKAWIAPYAPTQQLQPARSELQQDAECRPRTSDTPIATGSIIFNAPPPNSKDPESLAFRSGESNVASDSLTPALSSHRAIVKVVPPNNSPNASPSQPHGTQLAAHLPPQIVAQMSKLAGEQRNRTPHANSLSPGQPQEAYAGKFTGHHTMQSSTGTIWQGALTWTGFDAATQGRKDVCAEVTASLQSGGDSRSETWPSTMTLVPSREPAVSLQDLQTWIKRYKPVLCVIQPQAMNIDPKTNESHYRSLVQLLTTKNIYALAAWILPSGVQENNVLVFPVNRASLIGAFFPLSGIPELPKPIGPVTLQSNLALQQLQRLTPEQRNVVFARMMRQRQQQQQSLPQNQSSSTGVTTQTMVHLDNMTQRDIGGASNTRPGGLHGGGGVTGNVSYEIMQSFMQHSTEGAGLEGSLH